MPESAPDRPEAPLRHDPVGPESGTSRIGDDTVLARDISEPRPRTGAIQALLTPRPPDRADGLVRIVDTPEPRVRHPSDLLALVLCALGIALVLLLSVYAHATTEGVAEDVRGFNELLGLLLIPPLAVLEGLVTLVVPTAVLIELGIRRLGRQIVEAIAAAALGLLLGLVVTAVLKAWGSPELIRALSVRVDGQWQMTIPSYVAALGGLLTAAGTRTRRRTVAWSWNLLFIAIGVVLVTGRVSLPGIIITLLLGRIAGLALRYASGVRSERAYGPDLLTAVRRAGFSPTALVRVRDVTDSDALAEAAEDPITEVNADGEITSSVHVGILRAPGSTDTTVLTADAALAARHLIDAAHAPMSPVIPRDDATAPTGPVTAPSDPAAIALTRAGDNRVYAMFTADATRRDIVVLDGDRQVVGFLTRLWRSLRLLGLEGRTAISLRAAAERTALLSYAATAAGVRTPRLLGVGESVDSMVLVQEHTADAVSLRDLAPEELTDTVLGECWRQLALAHDAGLAHRALTSDIVLVSPPGDDVDGHVDASTTQANGSLPLIWLTGWEQGDIASSDLARRMDLTQMVALLALRVGARRAVASAALALPEDDIAAIGPLLQSVALPSSTREEMRQNRELLKELRAALVERLPEVDVEPQRITRFGARTIITLTLTIVAVTVVVTTINLEQMKDALNAAQPMWAVASFVLGMVTWFGAALTFVAFSPVRLPMFRATLTQAASSFVALAAPAGIGPAALNLRMLTRRGVSTPMAVATVALVQVSQFVVTVVLLGVLSVTTGQGGLIKMPSRTVLIAIAAVAASVLVTLLVPAVRTWVLGKIRPTVAQVWPRLSAMLSQPGRLALGLGGNVIMTLGYVLAFDAALMAFGQELSLIDVAVIYLLGNAAGAAVPTPGGLGTIELALVAGLKAAGVPDGIALSVTLVFRIATYWARIPIGWAAMRFLQRKGDL